VCIANIACHGSKADVRVHGEGNVLQGEAVVPLFPYQNQDLAPNQIIAEYAQPFDWTFTWDDMNKVEDYVKKVQLTYIQYCVLDIDDLEFCRNVGMAKLLLCPMVEPQ
jgi:hypothetical protein